MNGKEVARLEQYKIGKGKQTFVLHDDGTLLVTAAKDGNLQHFSMSLMGWNPGPVHVKNNPRVSRMILTVISVVLGLFMILMFFTICYAPTQGGTIFAPVFFLVVSGVLWTVLFTRHQRQCYDVLIFRNPMTGGQLVSHHNLPEENEFTAFVEALKAIIKKYPAMPLGQPETTIGKLREFARLRDEGILTDDEFEEAKRKVLSNMGSSSKIGFHP